MVSSDLHLEKITWAGWRQDGEQDGPGERQYAGLRPSHRDDEMVGQEVECGVLNESKSTARFFYLSNWMGTSPLLG